MIHYWLTCPQQHRFDGWFRSGEDFDRQQAASLVICPFCGSADIRKALMAPALGKKSRREPAANHENTSDHPVYSSGASPTSAEKDVSDTLQSHNPLLQHMRALRQMIMEKAEDVGQDFARKARENAEKDEPAFIRGKASSDEVRDLLDDGINVMPVPSLPEDHH
jgi:hypothetical protein